MKTIFTFCLFVFTLTVFSQQLHTVTGSDFQFTPDTLYANVGDTVVLNSIGYHSMTQLDSIDWENNVATNNGGFWVGFGAPIAGDTFIVNSAGTHYYNCTPHASMGMKGVIFATTATGIPSIENTTAFSIHWQQNGNLLLQYDQADQFELFTISGQLAHKSVLLKSKNTKSISLNLSNGIYIGVFKQNGMVGYSEKMIVR